MVIIIMIMSIMSIIDYVQHHQYLYGNTHDDLLTGGDPVAGGVGGDQRGKVDQREEGRLQQLHHDQGTWGTMMTARYIRGFRIYTRETDEHSPVTLMRGTLGKTTLPSATAWMETSLGLTNEMRVLRELTNERKVLRSFTNERRRV